MEKQNNDKDGWYRPVKRYESAGLHLVRYSKEDKCGRCCLCLEEDECGKWSKYCEYGYFMRTSGYVKTYKDIQSK